MLPSPNSFIQQQTKPYVEFSGDVSEPQFLQSAADQDLPKLNLNAPCMSNHTQCFLLNAAYEFDYFVAVLTSSNTELEHFG